MYWYSGYKVRKFCLLCYGRKSENYVYGNVLILVELIENNSYMYGIQALFNPSNLEVVHVSTQNLAIIQKPAVLHEQLNMAHFVQVCKVSSKIIFSLVATSCNCINFKSSCFKTHDETVLPAYLQMALLKMTVLTLCFKSILAFSTQTGTDVQLNCSTLDNIETDNTSTNVHVRIKQYLYVISLNKFYIVSFNIR